MVDPLTELNPSKPAAPGFALTQLTDGSCGIPFNAICVSIAFVLFRERFVCLICRLLVHYMNYFMTEG